MPQSGLVISLFLLISTHPVLVSLFSTKQAIPSNSTHCHSFISSPTPQSLSVPLPSPCYSSSISPRFSFPLLIQPLPRCHFLRDILSFLPLPFQQERGFPRRQRIRRLTTNKPNTREREGGNYAAVGARPHIR
ncbi:hypothetical protein CGRA01v4_04564 [Colletotrichum graminicola]|nr:hypothetical protein CGRA01v4_04564 [Colletotrichum graminicola]